MAIQLVLLSLLIAELPQGPCPASATSFTGARFDAPFFVFDGGSAGEGFGQFESPSAIAEIGSGLVAISDSGNHRIKINTLEGYFQDFWGSEGVRPGEFSFPGAIAATGDGSVWVVDSGNHRLQKLQAIQPLVADLTGTPLSTVGKRGAGKGQFENPTGIAIDSRGRILVVDSGNRRIQVLDARGNGLEEWRHLDWLSPWGISFEPDTKSIFVTDRARHKVSRLDEQGRQISAWGEPGNGEGELWAPHGITSHAGFLYVADTGNDRIVKFDLDGKSLGSVGCHGTAVGAFVDPVDVAIDADHHLYVVDRGNHRIQKLGHQ